MREINQQDIDGECSLYDFVYYVEAKDGALFYWYDYDTKGDGTICGYSLLPPVVNDSYIHVTKYSGMAVFIPHQQIVKFECEECKLVLSEGDDKPDVRNNLNVVRPDFIKGKL